MNKIWALGFALLFGTSLFVGSAIPTWAGEQTTAQGACPLDKSLSMPPVSSEYGTESLYGVLVTDWTGEELGRIAGVTFDSDEDVTNFIIVSSCLPGMSEKLVAIPFKANLNYSPIKSNLFPSERGILTLGLNKDEFMNAPRYSGTSGENWAKKALEYWENTPYFVG